MEARRPAHAREELVAEFGPAFFRTSLGIAPEVRDDYFAYVDHRLQAFAADSAAANQLSRLFFLLNDS
jgi:antirestriction protein ArdC